MSDNQRPPMRKFDLMGGMMAILFDLAEKKQVQVYSFERNVYLKPDAKTDYDTQVYWHTNWYEPNKVPPIQFDLTKASDLEQMIQHHRNNGLEVYGVYYGEDTDLLNFMKMIRHEIARLADIRLDQVEDYVQDNCTKRHTAVGTYMNTLFEIVWDSKFYFSSIDRRINFTEIGRRPTWAVTWYDPSAVPSFTFADGIYGDEERYKHQKKYGLYKHGEYTAQSDIEAIQNMFKSEVTRLENSREQEATNDHLI